MTDLEILELFNEKAETLRSYQRFMESIRNIKLEFQKTPNSDFCINFDGPDKELASACILTIRFFIQNKDHISINKMSDLYNNLSISQNYKDEFNQVRNELNKFLDSFSQITVLNKEEGSEILLANDFNKELKKEININAQVNIQKFTNGELFDLFVYGELAHADRDKREKLSILLSNNVTVIIVWDRFVDILIKFTQCIFAIEYINKKVISEIKL